MQMFSNGLMQTNAGRSCKKAKQGGSREKVRPAHLYFGYE